MRVISLTIAVAATVLGCSNDDNASFDGNQTGGASGMAGGGGGSSGSGGATPTTGGTAGKVGSGGAPGTGGSVAATGGSSGAASGGKGGASATGGKGGASAGGSAGASAGGNGGASTGGKGGTSGAGGMSKGGAGGVAQDAGPEGGDASLPVPTVEQLFPLAVGNVWNYNVTILPGSTGTPPCAAGMHATTITGRAMFANENAFTATHACAPTATRYYVENAQGLEVNLGTNWSLVLPRPISDGAMFQAASSQQILARVANITVAAGTFSNCWQTAYVSATGPVTTYCAGVGLVTLEYQAPSGGGYKLELTSYTIK